MEVSSKGSQISDMGLAKVFPDGVKHRRDSLGGEEKVSLGAVYTAPKPRPHTAAQGKQVGLVFSYFGFSFPWWLNW